MRQEGIKLKNYGIRLDSGDLAYLSKKARIMLDKAGFEDALICASSDLDENLIASLKLQGAKIDTWGVGTRLITSNDCPSFGGVYKLSAETDENGNFVPKIKLSNNPSKVTLPGIKKVIRIYDKESGKIKRTEEKTRMGEYTEECINTFLMNQGQLFDEPVAENYDEAEAFLEDCFAVVADNLDDVRAYMEEEGMDVEEMSDAELEEQSEVFALPDGQYLIVMG